MKTRLMLLLLVALVIALPGTLYAQESDPEALIKAVFEAMNAGDVEAALTLYAEDAVLNLGAFGKFSGKEGLRRAFENEVSLNASWEVSDFQVEGNTVTLKSVYTSDMMRSLGVTLEAVEVVTVEDGLIVSDVWTATDESLAAFQAATAALPQTGAGVLPLPAILAALGGLTLSGGLGLALARRRFFNPSH